MLRKTLQREVASTLDSSVFTSDDFEFRYKSRKPGFLFGLMFVHDNKFKFEVSEAAKPSQTRCILL